jgi:hypothetical protein
VAFEFAIERAGAHGISEQECLGVVTKTTAVNGYEGLFVEAASVTRLARAPAPRWAGRRRFVHRIGNCLARRSWFANDGDSFEHAALAQSFGDEQGCVELEAGQEGAASAVGPLGDLQRAEHRLRDLGHETYLIPKAQQIPHEEIAGVLLRAVHIHAVGAPVVGNGDPTVGCALQRSVHA